MSQSTATLALDIGGTSIRGGLFAGGECLALYSMPVDSAAGAEEVAGFFRACGRCAAGEAQALGVRLTGVGAGVPGPFDYMHGASLMTHKFASVRGVCLTGWLLEALGDLPVRYISDSEALLRGSLQQLPRQERNLCAIIIGTGLGIGAMVEGRMLVDDNHGPAIKVFRHPYRDSIAEDYVSKRAIMGHYARRTGRMREVSDIARLARQGEGEARAVFDETGLYLAEILAPLVREYDFDCIILGGQISKSGVLLSVPLKKRLEELGLSPAVIVPPDIDMAPLLGAVAGLEESIQEKP